MTLELRKISASYDGHAVLRDVDLVVPDRSVVALLGPNGAGKTTLLRVASGLLRPDAGQMLLDEQDVTGWPADRALPQDPSVRRRRARRHQLSRVELSVARQGHRDLRYRRRHGRLLDLLRHPLP